MLYLGLHSFVLHAVPCYLDTQISAAVSPWMLTWTWQNCHVHLVMWECDGSRDLKAAKWGVRTNHSRGNWVGEKKPDVQSYKYMKTTCCITDLHRLTQMWSVLQKLQKLQKRKVIWEVRMLLTVNYCVAHLIYLLKYFWGFFFILLTRKYNKIQKRHLLLNLNSIVLWDRGAAGMLK